jgi:penicillin-binding protein 1A
MPGGGEREDRLQVRNGGTVVEPRSGRPVANPGPRSNPADRSRPPARRPPRRGARAQSRGRGRTRFLNLTLLFGLWMLIAGSCLLGYFALTLPDTSVLARTARRPGVTILAADGTVLATHGELFGQPLTLRQMPRYLPEAVIATEDRRFYRHFGIDPFGLGRAALADLTAGHIVEGGSTITQQLARNLFLTPARNLARKVRETLLALWLEHRFTKNEILEIYLNRVYLGAGTYGVDAAAQRYFGKSARRLDLWESAVVSPRPRRQLRRRRAKRLMPLPSRGRACTILPIGLSRGWPSNPISAAAI